MGIMVACGLTGGDATIAGKYYAAGKDDECDQEDTFHVFHFWVYRINTTSNRGKNYPDRCYRITFILWKRYGDNRRENNRF
jgi:hypothetical protein